MTMISPERGNLVYLATKTIPAGAGNETGGGGASVTNDKSVGAESGGALGDVMSGATSGITDVANASTDALKSWLPIVLVGVAVFFIWKYV